MLLYAEVKHGKRRCLVCGKVLKKYLSLVLHLKKKHQFLTSEARALKYDERTFLDETNEKNFASTGCL